MSNLISSRTINQIRRVVAASFDATCTIERKNAGVDEFGAPDDSWTTVASDVPCRVIDAGDQNRGTTGSVGGQEQTREMYRLIVSHNTDLSGEIRVTVGGVVYQVVRVVERRTQATDAQAIITRSR